MVLNSTDESSMTAVRKGARADLEILFDRHHLALYEFFYRMTGDRAASENLVQEVFCRMLKLRETFRDESRFKPWLFRIARMAHHDAYLPTAIQDVTDVAHKDKPQALRDALLKLPGNRRELIVFSQYLQLTAEEIAELLDMDVPAAKVGVHRAMMELRDLYRTISR